MIEAVDELLDGLYGPPPRGRAPRQLVGPPLELAQELHELLRRYASSCTDEHAQAQGFAPGFGPTRAGRYASEGDRFLAAQGLPPYTFAGGHVVCLPGVGSQVQFSEDLLPGLVVLAVVALEDADRPVPPDLAAGSARMLLGGHAEVRR